MPATSTARPASAAFGLTAVGVFLVFAAMMALLAGISLERIGADLHPIWTLNPRAYHELAPVKQSAGIAFLLLAAILALAAFGWFRRRLWAWRLTALIITTQVLGDLVNLWRGNVLPGIFGIAIAGALLVYILRPNMRSEFT